MEKLINTVLWIVLLAFIALAVHHWYKNNYEPVAYQQPTEHAPPLFKLEKKAERSDNEPWFRQHFTNPVPAQGDAPEEWTEIEASLSPKECGVCHPAQLADWQDSWHAKGMGPGMMGQLVDWDGPRDGMVKQCQSCHAPLTEQYPRLDGEANPLYDAEMREQGLTCAGCHVRQHARLGPPTETHPADPMPQEAEDAEETEETETASVDAEEAPRQPHDGFIARDEFQDAMFCEHCHDFRPGQNSLEDKLIQETYEEYLRTDFAAEGITCQSCHMPEGRHTFKGIHDPEMARAAFTPEAKLVRLGEAFMEPLEATLTITNTGAGHRFPTYTTPTIVLSFEQVDVDGVPIEGTRDEGYVSRYVKPNLSEEFWDTRLMPGEAFTLTYRSELRDEASALRARVEVWPDDGYTRFYEIKTQKFPEDHPKGNPLLEEALQASIDSRFVAWEGLVPLNQ